MTRTQLLLAGAAMLAALAGFHTGGPGVPDALAQMQHQHAAPGHGPAHGMAADDSESTRAFRAANDRMHEAMAIAYTGRVEEDFVRGMIPHHQGAIDMARVVLDHGTDPEIRALAEAIVATQEAEIATMEAWLTANAH